MMGTHHYNNKENISTTLKVLCALSFHLIASCQSQAITDFIFFSFHRFAFFQNVMQLESYRCVAFSDRLLLLSFLKKFLNVFTNEPQLRVKI